MATSQTKASQSNEELQAEISKLREELSALTAQVKEGVAPTMRDTARKAGRAAAASAAELRDQAREYGEAGVAAARTQVRDHPFMAVGLSFVVGALAALLLRR